MNLLNKSNQTTIWTTLSILCLLAGSGHGETRRREEQKAQEELDKARQELQLYQKQLEDVRVKRWQDKRNTVAAQEAFTDVWNELKADIDRLTQMRNQKEESLLRMQSQESAKQNELEEQENRLKQFGLQVRDKIGEFEKNWEQRFPYRSIEKLGQISSLKKMVEQVNAATPPVLGKLFDLTHEDFQAGDSREIARDKLVLQRVVTAQGPAATAVRLDPKSQAREVAGYRVRLGQGFQAFASTEGEDVAILGKTGRLDAQAWEWIEELPPEVRKNLHGAIMRLAGDSANAMALLPMDVLLTKATGEGFTTKSQNSFWKSVKREFEEGGWVMWLILTVACGGLFIIANKVFVFVGRDQSAAKLSARVHAFVEAGRIEDAKALCVKARGSVGRVLLAILEKAGEGREAAEGAAHEVMLHEAPLLEKRITTMNILAAAAPLVGLLGTVTGMVRLFEVITVHGTGNPKLMAGGISEALIATKWGLGTAIPLLLSYNWLDTWSAGIISNMEKYSARLVNTLFSGARRRVGEPVV